MDKVKIITLFILALLICESYPKRDFFIYISHVNCTSPSKIMTVTCSITRWNNRNQINGFNMLLQTSEDVDKSLYNISIQYHTPSGKPQKFLEFNNLNACDFNGAKFISPILLIARKIMAKYSNIPNGCPLKKGIEYYIQRMKFDPEQFPSSLPKGEFEVFATLYKDKLTLLQLNLGLYVALKLKPKQKPKRNK